MIAYVCFFFVFFYICLILILSQRIHFSVSKQTNSVSVVVTVYYEYSQLLSDDLPSPTLSTRHFKTQLYVKMFVPQLDSEDEDDIFALSGQSTPVCEVVSERRQCR